MRKLLLIMVSFLWSSSPVFADKGAWLRLQRSDLDKIRVDATATLLPTGKVLVAGGSGTHGEVYDTAELYDPATRTWTFTKSLNGARTQHTATLLPTGEVLVTGGLDVDGSALATAELYDPVTGKWKPIDDKLSRARFQHTATLLHSGQVLVVGGFDEAEKALQTAELYNPPTRTWTPAALLGNARGQHTATLLPSGEVLVAGGRSEQGPQGHLVAETEVYNREEGKWSSGTALAQPRICHTATLLPSGEVLVAGGSQGNKCGTDASPFTPATTVELYDPEARQPKWKTSQNAMNANRALHSAVLLPSGKLLVAGGLPRSTEANPNGLTPGSEIYDWSTDRWQPDADFQDIGGNFRQSQTATLLPSGEVLLAGGDRLLPTEIYEPSLSLSTRKTTISSTGYATAPTATLLKSGNVLVAGGSFKGAAIAMAWIYNPMKRKWSPTAPLMEARVGHTATLLPDGNVLVVGGRNAKGLPLASVEIYDPSGTGTGTATGSWSSGGGLMTARSGHTATLLPSGRVLIAGGEGTSALDSAEIYDPSNGGSWTTTGPMNEARFEHAAVLLATGKVLVAGGFNGDSLGSAELYDPGLETWELTGPLRFPRKQATATFLPDGRALLAGGVSRNQLAKTEVYDPKKGSWTFAPRLKNARSEHTALLLPSGKILFAGGWGGPGVSLNAVELYDPWLGSVEVGDTQKMRRSPAAALLPSGEVLLAGGTDDSGRDLNTAEILDLEPGPATPRPVITSMCHKIDFGIPCTIEGHFRSDLEASGGGSNNTAVNYPLLQLTSLEGERPHWLVLANQPNFSDDPMTLTVRELPAGLNPGWHRLTVFNSGRAGASRLVEVGCGLVITRQPQDQTVRLGHPATFSVEAQGGQTFQWLRNGRPITGATASSYEIKKVAGEDARAQFEVKVFGHCRDVISTAATLRILDDQAPVAHVVSPRRGEYWPLSKKNSPNQRLITWWMSDNVRICQVKVSLRFSEDGGLSYQDAPDGGGLPGTFVSPDDCRLPPGVTETSTTYELPEIPPSGKTGSLYRIRLEVTNQQPRSTVVESDPFYIVQSNPDSVRTLILTNKERLLSIFPNEADQLFTALQELADHPRVQGWVEDLSKTVQAEIYAKWPGDPQEANLLLFGEDGIHDRIRKLLETYTGAKYLVLVGDDRIIPFARIDDRTGLLSEKEYTEGDHRGLSPTGTTVGQALADGKILSDDPLATRAEIRPGDLADTRLERAFLPDLAVGRLVETPAEISTTISTFISRDGVLDLTLLNPKEGHKILVTGYDFLLDSGRVIRERWNNALGLDDDTVSVAPVDGVLLDQDWGTQELSDHLCGNGNGQPYGISFLNGHATHDREGVPTGEFDQGLEASEISKDLCRGEDLNLEGGVVFAVGCHGGLPVPDIFGQERTRDLPQTFLDRGAVAYVANTGFGWGLFDGIGYAERLMQILAEEMSRGGTVVTGEAVKRTKLRYFQESPRLDPYDKKSLLQWSFFGLPMYAVKTGISGLAESGSQVPFADVSSVRADRPAIEQYGDVIVERRGLETSPETITQVAAAETQAQLPPYLTRLDIHFDLSADGVYTKRGASGVPIKSETKGCPPEETGCYYTLNGLVDRATGMSDHPIQPYFIYDSRLAGTSQHGVLWTGGTFKEESNWKPVIAELASNRPQGLNPGSLPAHYFPKPTRRKSILGAPDRCPVSDLEVNSLVVPTGEAIKKKPNTTYSIQRLFTSMSLEVLYYNNAKYPAKNCDNSGPSIDSQVHQVDKNTVTWTVEATDLSEVWRVVVVYNESGSKEWLALDLDQEGSTNIWKGEVSFGASPHLNYVVQAVDRRGNVSWLDYKPSIDPDSGVSLEVPMVEEVTPHPNQ